MTSLPIRVREALESEEHDRLSPLAAFADETRGRCTPLALDPFRTEFQRVAAAKAQPDKLDYGAGSAGYQLMAELFNESVAIAENSR